MSEFASFRRLQQDLSFPISRSSDNLSPQNGTALQKL